MYSRCDVSADYYLTGLTTYRTTGNKTHTALGATANSDVEAARDAGTIFSLAWRMDTEALGTDYAEFTEYTHASNYATLTITHAAASGASNQEGFAFGDDDGTESGHTLGTQDTNHSGVLGTKSLRLINDTTGDVANTAYKLKYQKNGTGGYTDVPIVASTSGVAGPIEAGDVTGSSSNSTTTSLSLAYPAYVSGDLIIFHIACWKGNNTVTIPSGPNGETGVAIINGYSVDGGANTPSNIIFYYIGTGTVSASNLSVTSSISTRHTTACVKVLAGEFDPTTPISAGTGQVGNGATSGSNPEIDAFTAGSTDGGGKLIAHVSVDQDPISGTPTGWTDIYDSDAGRASGVVSVRDADVTDSESITGDGGWTIATDAWGVWAYIVRPSADVNNDVYISASANVAAGGEATTARLTAPSGKSGNFTTGRRWDDENGTDSIDIVSDYYSEFEWILTTQSPAVTTDYFEFRLYAADTVLGTYTVTPKWTISAGGGGATGKSNPLMGCFGGCLAGPIG